MEFERQLRRDVVVTPAGRVEHDVLTEKITVTEGRGHGPAHRHRRKYRLTLRNVQGPGSVVVTTRHRGEHG